MTCRLVLHLGSDRAAGIVHPFNLKFNYSQAAHDMDSVLLQAVA